ncbi:hypothetical protein BKA56DRAFT_663184 [Ilyonectria sp. MPI-CAGE-AT-0026]|nr:hypothetical protein BKA56DRAFT_663184 [Ilyonectria sp. MPI-CAGE-AT-0026]
MSPSAKPSQLETLPSEILREIIKCLIDKCTMNKDTGYPHPYYSPNRGQAEEERKRSLLAISLSSRKLNATVAPFLYQHVILMKGIELDVPQLSTEKDQIFPDRGIATLALFLRTMLERPQLRKYIHHLDLRFFLLYFTIKDWLGPPQSSLRAVTKWELGFSQMIFSCAKSEYDCAVLDHVGLSNGGTSHDLAERIFTAILCLIPQLRTLAFPPPPGKAWCRGYVVGFDDDDSAHTDRCTYNTLNSLLGRAYHDARLSSATLQNLDAVRLTSIPRTDSWNATAQIDACLSILQAPNLKELKTDMDTATRGIWIAQPGRAFLALAAFDQEMLEYVCKHWPLTALGLCATYGSKQEPFYWLRPQAPVTDVNIWDTPLKALATTLKTLDLAPQTTKWRADQQLSCLPSLVALEHLRMGLPLLNSNDGFATRPLATILPPRLKMLTINDWYAPNRYEPEEEEEEEYFFLQNNPLPHLRLLSLALDESSRTCSRTHPFLRSVMVFGSFPIQALSFKAERNALKQAGPRPGQVLVDGERVQKQFAESGVVFQEFRHDEECDYRFRDVHVF